jgi:hypothetical protein
MKWVVAVSLLASITVAGVAQAGVAISGNTSTSTGGLDDFTGTVNYNSTTDIFTVTLENTLAPTGNLITGFAFDTPTGYRATLQSPANGFQNLVDPSTAPFGTFTSGAALGGDWLGGGNPNGGIALDQTETFNFLITGTKPNTLFTESFLPGDFAVRFRGGNGSDKLLSAPSGSTVPLPQAVWPGIAALLGLGLASRRSRKTVVG